MQISLCIGHLNTHNIVCIYIYTYICVSNYMYNYMFNNFCMYVCKITIIPIHSNVIFFIMAMSLK